MNKHFTICLRFGLSLMLTIGPLTSLISAGARKSSTGNRNESGRRPVSKKYLTRKKEDTKLRAAQDTTVVRGRSTTLLADGRSLLVGGEGDFMATAVIVDPQTGQSITLASKLLNPRMGHSSTMLPDGTVLILGGIGTRGQFVDSAEIFNPENQRFEARAATGLSPRANHTATVLTDGHLLVAGGTDAKGNLTTKVELFDIRKNTATVVPSRLAAARQNHTAVLQADGSVVLSRGTDANGEIVQDDEVFDPESSGFRVTVGRAARENHAAPQLEFSAPGNGALEIDENTSIALRFSKPLSVKTINKTSVVLEGPLGSVATRVVPAESGMLTFVTPLAALQANSQYNLTITGGSDVQGQPLPFVTITFKTKQCPANRTGAGCETRSPLDDLDSWIPNAKNLNGDWSTRRPDSPSRSLSPLQAPAGETALAGQVLTLSGKPLANVTLQIDERSVVTDFTGRFLLRGLEAGKKVLTIQGHTASRPGKIYGTFDVLVDIVAAKTTALSYTIWLPVLDEQNAVRLPIPTQRELAVTTPRIPGMEVRVPSDAVLRLPGGKHHSHGMTKRELESMTITPMPVDRPPFPLPPGMGDVLLFTLQLHGAKVEGLNGEKRRGLQIIYPNYGQFPAGTRVTFWNYEAEQGGWYVYGQGSVTSDQKQVLPDPGVELQSMHCASFMTTGTVPGDQSGAGSCAEEGDPVDISTGLFVYDKTDLILPDVIPISLMRTYRQKDSVERSFGKGMTNPYDIYVAGNTSSYGQIVLPDGGLILFNKIPNSALYEHTATPTPFYKATMRMISGVGPNGAWEVKLADGTIYQFGIKVLLGDILGVHASITGLSAIQDRYGNRLTVTRDSSFRMTKVTSPGGRWIQFSYSDSSKRIAQATDSSGRVVTYTYDANGRLWKVTDAKGGVTEYLYDASSDRMLTIKDPRGFVFLTNEYDSNGRIRRQTQIDGGVYEFAYTLNGSGKVSQTDVTNPRGFIRRATFNANGYLVTDTFAQGTTLQQTYTYEREAGSNFLLSMTDPLGRKTTWTYNSVGKVTSFTRLADTANAVTTNLTYEPVFNQVVSVTDPLNHTTTYAYSLRGRLTSATNSLGHKTTFKYNQAAELTDVVDPLGNTTRFNYAMGIPIESIDPLGRSNSKTLDAAGRVTSVTSPLGQVGRYEYDNLNHITQSTNPLNGVTTFSYDANGNLLSVKDARNNETTYTYDNMDRVVTRRDPLLHDDTYEYDLNGNLKKYTDRKGQITNFSYDAHDRLTLVTYGDSSTTSYTYDAANRLTQSVDSVSGTITYDYDSLDRLTSETTPQGTVTYAYDAAGRRTSMTVTGQAAVNYTYDNANRLTQVTQGSSTVTFSYDAADRRTSVTLPSGLVTEYSYDAASQLIAVTYKQNQTVIGNLAYQYDGNGNRTKVSGSLARNVATPPVTTASYNAANQQTSFGSKSLAYDLNGHLTSDGSNTYTWNARKQLVSISGPGVTASFQYDASGRRTGATINGDSTTFLYDGQEIVAEQSSQGLAQMLSGSVDEIFLRRTSTDTNVLTDGLGNVVSLHGSSGGLQTEYSYGDFGQPGYTGTASINSRQYTGREFDGATGLHYYRARYYSPALLRFISEDPLGFGSGDSNLYAYVFNNPINYTDPWGLSIWKKVIKVFTQSGELVAVVRKPLSKDKKMERVKDAIEEARKRGNHPGVVVQAPDKDGAKTIADALDPKGRSRGPEKSGGDYPEHYNPKSGDYEKVHVQWDTPKRRLAMIFAPHSMTVSGRKNATNMQFASAVLWDIASTIDPIFITDGIDWGLGLSCP
ncbi:MAG TPA: RHS repeat-associated core domain-containing protein [Pyrinomonadaceae bacterium]|nr:RHS repeat-associated core domain-containing protein [Pyrinomonadaceae bacterium]